MQFGIPGFLYFEEIDPGSPGFEYLSLQTMEVSGDLCDACPAIARREQPLLPEKSGLKPGHKDYFRRRLQGARQNEDGKAAAATARSRRTALR
jgi:hypothetical protein